MPFHGSIGTLARSSGSRRDLDPRNGIETLTALGWHLLRAGERAGALRHFARALELHRQSGWGAAAEPIEGVAAVAALAGRPGEAVRLWGAVSTLRRQRRLAPHAFARDADAARDAGRAALGEEAADAGYQAGAALSAEQALAEALAVAELVDADA